MDVVAELELPLTNISDLEEFLDSVDTVERLLDCPTFHEEGREFTYEEYDPTPGMLIKRTIELLDAPKKKKSRPASAAFDISKVKFMSEEEDEVKKE
jgi:hypothetical protein